MTNGRYMLDADHNPYEADDLMDWAKAFEECDRRVGDDEVGEVRVSTIFLALDHSFGSGPPLLFETMVFGPESHPLVGEMDRYETWDQAEAGHKAMLARLFS